MYLSMAVNSYSQKNTVHLLNIDLKPVTFYGFWVYIEMVVVQEIADVSSFLALYVT